MNFSSSFSFLILTTCLLLQGSAGPALAANQSIGQTRARQPMRLAADWIRQESQIAVQKLKENISPAGTARGVVIASPQNANPDYYRHWVRDAALTMDVVFELSQTSADLNERKYWEKALRDYTYFSRENQLAQTLVQLGEPIFEVSGQPFLEPWGRPQNDGPALRAIALTHWAQVLLDRGEADFVRTWLYSGQLPAQTVIKADLEYVSHHWQDGSFDLWEEVKGQHFFTQMVQRKALLLGANLAARLKDPEASRWYISQARALEKNIESHWDEGRGLLVATRKYTEGANYKNSQVDVAVVLGIIHGTTGDFQKFSDAKVQATFEKLVSVFSELYKVNRMNAPGLAIGRYPEDLYAGTDFNGGNPWVLATLAAAQFCYESASEVAAKQPRAALAFFERGDNFFQRVQFHSNPDGSLSEQIQRNSGYMVSARDLTWNYSAILTAAWARQRSLQILKLNHHNN